MSTTKRRTIEQQIADAVVKLNLLKAKQKDKAKVKSELTADSNGMKQLLELVATVAKNNKT